MSTNAPLKNVTKVQVTKAWNLYKENSNTKKTVIDRIPGVTITASYYYDFSLRYSHVDIEVDETDVKLSKAMKELDNYLGGYTLDELIGDNADPSDFVPTKEYNAVQKAWSAFIALLPETTRRALGNLDEYSDVEAFWKAINDIQTGVKPAGPTTIKLTSDYDAIITKGRPNIRVGCQSIPIETLRQVLATVDELNSK